MAVITEMVASWHPHLHNQLVQAGIKVIPPWFSRQGGSNKIRCRLISDRVGNGELPLTLVAGESNMITRILKRRVQQPFFLLLLT